MRISDWSSDVCSSDLTTLARGLGRSYGDSGLNLGGGILAMAGLARAVAFDRTSGVLRADAGMSIDALLRLTVTPGWFVPDTPGTNYVTLCGCVASYRHGQNHHVTI